MVYELVRKTLLAGLGVQEKVKELVDDLVKKGELNENEGAKLMKEWVDRAKVSTEDLNKMVNESIAMGLDKVNIASREDLDELGKKVQQLSARVKKLENDASAKGEETI
ncbi:MAG TPA: phasin family protein [Nitrospirota bacterium]|jgi:poly(hydroxyalkanoate) granule-associated protein